MRGLNNGGARSLSSNQIGDAGATAIGEALKTNVALTGLCLDFNLIGYADVREMEQLFRTDANRAALEASDPLCVGDIVRKTGEGGAPLVEIVQVDASASPDGHGAYSLRLVTLECTTLPTTTLPTKPSTFQNVPRWRLQPCSLCDLLRFSKARWRALRESTTPTRFLVRVFDKKGIYRLDSPEAKACAARLWECVSLETVEFRPALMHTDTKACGIVVKTRPSGWKTPFGQFVKNERVRIKGSRDMWRVKHVSGRTATVVRDREDIKEQRVCVPFEEMTLVGEWAHVWHVFNVARDQGIQLRQMSAALVALSGTAIAMRTRSIVESYLGPA